jgi:CheY-like chemotaxis protein
MTGTRSVLVIEPVDDRGGLADALRCEGLTVEAVNDAPAAMAAVASARHGIIVVDLPMPALSADAVVGALRRVTPRPVVLVITDDLAALRSNFAGDVVHGCFGHPPDDRYLVELIRDCAAALRAAGAVAPGTGTDRAISDLLR